MTLYELTGQFRDLYCLFDDGEITEQTFNDTLEAMDFMDNFLQKIDGYASVVKQLEADTKALKDEIDRLSARKKACEFKIMNLKDRLLLAMNETNNPKIKTTLFSLGVRKSPPSLLISEDAVVPDAYLVQQAPKIDKKSLMEYVKSGNSIDGISIQQGEHLRIN